jgi:hypothetical protein
MPTRRTLISAAVAVSAVITFSAGAHGQICSGSQLSYVVRNEQGVAIDGARKDLTIGPGKVAGPSWTSNRDFRYNDQTPKTISSLRGRIAVLETSGMCTFTESVKLQLALKGKRMSLTFLTPKLSEYDSRDFFVDSVPFQQGTFEIELKADPKGASLFYPAAGWKKVKD